MKPEQVTALRKKNNDTGNSFHLTGLKNVGDLVEDSESEDENSVSLKTPSKYLFGSLMDEARKGSQDVATPEKRKADYERSIARPTTQQPTLPSEIPSLRDLQRMTNALQDGFAFQGDSYRPDYRPNNVHRPQSPYRPESPPISHHTYHPANPYQLIKFPPPSHPLAPELGLERLSANITNYASNGTLRTLTTERHGRCPELSHLARGKILAQRIVQKFTDIENDRLSARDRRDSLEARRPPPVERVERGLDAGDRRKEVTEKLQQQAQYNQHRGEQAKGLAIDDLEDDDEPVTKPKKAKDSDRNVEDTPTKPAMKKIFRRQPVLNQNLDDESDEGEVVEQPKVKAPKSFKEPEPLQTKRKASRAYFYSNEISYVSPQPDPAKKPTAKNRKASIAEDAEQPAKKKGRKEHKSAAIIVDGHEELNYELPDAVSALPDAPVMEEKRGVATEVYERVETVEAMLEDDGAETLSSDDKKTSSSAPVPEQVPRSTTPQAISSSSSQTTPITPSSAADKLLTLLTSPAPAPTPPHSTKRKLPFDESSDEDDSPQPPGPLKKMKKSVSL
ncbi:hypothetical protein EJ02DRAFT_489574 [Clathrospora elynae]|uniref:Uncharacterized protein n=1 Tax=Clathrospora elynae TaxID=706981 RepID=A0A6A5T8L1_9PLEO|nr:hypothetical protein EJ02DRAFT_489574 [Clathrospora elynae]